MVVTSLAASHHGETADGERSVSPGPWSCGGCVLEVGQVPDGAGYPRTRLRDASVMAFDTTSEYSVESDGDQLIVRVYVASPSEHTSIVATLTCATSPGGNQSGIWKSVGDQMQARDLVRATRDQSVRWGQSPVLKVAPGLDDEAPFVLVQAREHSPDTPQPLFFGVIVLVVVQPARAWLVSGEVDGEDAFWRLASFDRDAFGQWMLIFLADVYPKVKGAELEPQLSLGTLLRSDARGVSNSFAPAHPLAPSLPWLAPDEPAVAVSRTGAVPASFIGRLLGAAALATHAIDRRIDGSPIGGDRLPWAAFVVGLFVYVISRIWGLVDYPLSFDGDEAAIVVIAQQLIASGFRDSLGIFLPIFFPYPNWNPDVGLYVHAVTSSVFGVSVIVARLTAVFLTLPAPIALGFALRWGFSARAWWLAPYVLSTLPIWFHLSRSAYDSATWVSFFSCAIAAYYRYRYQDGTRTIPVVVFLVLTFYSNSVAHLISLGFVIIALIIDIQYHLIHWRSWGSSLTLAFASSIPLAIFINKNPSYIAARINSSHPHWMDQSLSLTDIIWSSVRTFRRAFNPMIWFTSTNRTQFVDVTGFHNYFPGTMELLPLWIGPIIIVGLGMLILPKFRTVCALLLGMLILTLSPSLVSRFSPTRALAVIVPVVLLALYWVDLVVPRARIQARILGAGAILLLTASTALTVVNALTIQTTRPQDYGGFGIQWGSKEVFGLITRFLRLNPSARVMVTTDWSWGAHHFLRFFLPPKEFASGRVFLGSLDTLYKSREPWGPVLWVALTPAHYQRIADLVASPTDPVVGGRVVRTSIQDTILHPDGTVGFVFAKIEETSDIERVLASQRANLSMPSYAEINVGAERVRVGFTSIDDGDIGPVLNRVDGALVRFAGPNPTVVDLEYASPRLVKSIGLTLSSGLWNVVCHGFDGIGSEVVVVSGNPLPVGPNAELTLRPESTVLGLRRIRLEIFQLNASEDDSTVHLYRLAID